MNAEAGNGPEDHASRETGVQRRKGRCDWRISQPSDETASFQIYFLLSTCLTRMMNHFLNILCLALDLDKEHGGCLARYQDSSILLFKPSGTKKVILGLLRRID